MYDTTVILLFCNNYTYMEDRKLKNDFSFNFMMNKLHPFYFIIIYFSNMTTFQERFKGKTSVMPKEGINALIGGV